MARSTYKVCDFGLSPLTHAKGWGRGRVTGRSGMVTSKWMAPEVITSEPEQLVAHPFARDVYSFAILAWEGGAGGRVPLHWFRRKPALHSSSSRSRQDSGRDFQVRWVYKLQV